MNVITVDWRRLASGPDYTRAASSTGPVGERVARFIEFLIAQGTPSSAFHIVGFSLGAQVAGATGGSLRSARLPRITGLDPAGPEFETPPKFRSLSSADADFVDVIHTNGIPVVGFGIKRPVGHVDFFPNGGSFQPGCKLPTESIIPLSTCCHQIFLFEVQQNTFPREGWCPHSRAYLYFAESITARRGIDALFVASRCSSLIDLMKGRCGFCKTSQLNTTDCVLMGEDTPTT